MSRSQPNETLPHPCQRWFELDGKLGHLRFFDKEKKERIDYGTAKGFEFVLLDKLSTIKGWSEENESGLYSNEVKDTRSDPFVVKAFKRKEPIAEGFYSDIRDKIKANGGKFVTMLYIAYRDKETDEVTLGSLALKGGSLRSWMNMEGEGNNRSRIFKDAIRIADVKEGKKGGVTFKMLVFEITEVDAVMNDIATELDRGLQSYYAFYFKRNKVEQAEPLVDNEEEQFPQNSDVEAGERDDPLPF